MFFYVKHFDSENFDTVTEQEFSSPNVKDNLKFELEKKYSVTKNGVTKVVVIVYFSDKIEELNEKIKKRPRLPPKKFIQSESELDIEKTKAEVKENTQEEIEEFDKLLEEKMTNIVYRQEEDSKF